MHFKIRDVYLNVSFVQGGVKKNTTNSFKRITT